jgi:hypothetical protein
MQKVKDIVSISSGKVLWLQRKKRLNVSESSITALKFVSKVLPVIVQFLWFLVVGKRISLP